MFGLFNHRSADVEHAAAGAGVRFAEGDPLGCERAPFPLLRRGDRRTVERVLWREEDPHAMRVFDFRYERTWGEETTRSPLFTCCTMLANASWPFLQIEPASAASDLAGPFAGEDRVESMADDFDDAFVVHSREPRFVSALLDAEMRSFLLDKARALTIELNGAWAMVSAEDVPPRLLPALFGFADDLLDRLVRVTRALYPGPRPGDLHRPMPDPAVVADCAPDQLEDALDAFDRGGPGGARNMADVVLGFSPLAPSFLRSVNYAAGSEVVEQAIRREMLDDPSWDSMDRSRLDALDDPEEVERDIDGNPIPTGLQDPWGPGRPDRPGHEGEPPEPSEAAADH